MVGEGFEPSKAVPSDLQSDPFDRSGTPPGKRGIILAPARLVNHTLNKKFKTGFPPPPPPDAQVGVMWRIPSYIEPHAARALSLPHTLLRVAAMMGKQGFGGDLVATCAPMGIVRQVDIHLASKDGGTQCLIKPWHYIGKLAG